MRVVAVGPAVDQLQNLTVKLTEGRLEGRCRFSRIGACGAQASLSVVCRGWFLDQAGLTNFCSLFAAGRLGPLTCFGGFRHPF